MSSLENAPAGIWTIDRTFTCQSTKHFNYDTFYSMYLLCKAHLG